MRLICPNCTSQYEVDGSLFPDEGREVQCSNCEHTWVQYPERPEEPAPLRLDTMAPVAAAAPEAERPSDRLSQDEKAALRAAVAEELNTRDSDMRGAPRTVDVSQPPQPQEEEIDEDKILASLREQIAIEGEIDDSSAPKSQRRNLKKAAEAVGISVMEEDDAQEAKKGKAGKSGAHRTDPARDKLAEALKEYEEERRERRKTGRVGFIAALVLCGMGLGLYVMKDSVVAAYPPAEPYVSQYADLVDNGRDTVEALYAEYAPMVMGQINNLTAGEETATTE